MTIESYAVEEAWKLKAACRGMDSSIWFPEAGGRNTTAHRICRTCSVQEPCLDLALRYPEPDAGIWAGTDPKTRRKLRKRRGEVAA
jgi:WhiB family redox-sensing transcriptional regulator